MDALIAIGSIIASYAFAVGIGYFFGILRSRKIAKMSKKEWESFKRDYRRNGQRF